MCNCSYDAAEENEISFREGERIVDIEAMSDNWWQGKMADGSVRLFPGILLLVPMLARVSLPDVVNCVEVQQ